MTPLRKAAIDALQTLETLTANWSFVAGYVHNTIVNLHHVLSQDNWVGLTDEEVESWRGNYDFFDSALVREVEAKLKEKNS